MGLDVSCHLIFGVEVERFTKQVVRKKFHEDTGEPYDKTENVKAFRLVGAAIEVQDDSELFCVDHESDAGWFLGVKVASTSSHQMGSSRSQWFDVPTVTDEQKKHVEEMLGFAIGRVAPKLIVYQHFSY